MADIKDKTILYIEDEAMIASGLKRDLERNLGCYVTYFQEASEAEKAIEEGTRYNLMLVDWSLKDFGSGMRSSANELIKLSHKFNPSAPVLILSCYTDVSHTLSNASIDKCLDNTVICESVKRWLEMGHI